jgi:hypothetical protein
LVPSLAPSFNWFRTPEDTPVSLQVSGVDPEGQPVFVRILNFPRNGTLFTLFENGQMGPPVPEVSTHESETTVGQWVSEVVAVSGEWTSTSAFLSLINVSMASVLNGSVPQTLFGGCSCTLGLLGPADCPSLNADCAHGWKAPAVASGRHMITVRFASHVFPSQVEVYVPYGGRQLVRIDAWNGGQNVWSTMYSATDCDVDVTLSPGADVEYAVIQADVCRPMFPVDTIRLIFDTDLTQQWLVVDAVRLLGTPGLPSGAVTNLRGLLAYVPHPHVYGLDFFSYTVTDCAFKEDRTSVAAQVTVQITGRSDPPFIPRTNFSVSGASLYCCRRALPLLCTTIVVRIVQTRSQPCLPWKWIA